MEEALKATAVTEHAIHCPDDLRPQIICHESNGHLRRIKESLFIRNNCTINRDRVTHLLLLHLNCSKEIWAAGHETYGRVYKAWSPPASSTGSREVVAVKCIERQLVAR
uniref:Protein kinase domain-containing protein n=1 Tax=Trichuris muris TaxID=70415 RepID=A0A5S6QJ42_TRIMR